MKRSHFSHILTWLILINLLLLPVSWIVSATFPESHYHSLIGADGIRWMLMRLTWLLSSPLLVWLLFASIAWGSISFSKLPSSFWAYYRSEKQPFRVRLAVRLSCALTLVSLLVVYFLALAPHAPLLGITGGRQYEVVVPLTCLLMTGIGVFHAFVAGMASTSADLFDLLSFGLRRSPFVILFYLVFMQLYFSLRYVFDL